MRACVCAPTCMLTYVHMLRVSDRSGCVPPQDLGVSGEQLTIERLHGSDEPRSEFVVRAGATHVIVLGLTANATVALIRNMEGVSDRRTSVAVVIKLQGSYGALKTLNVLEFCFQNSRPGKCLNFLNYP